VDRVCNPDSVTASPAQDPESWFDLPVLTGSKVTLRPLVEADAAGYLAAAGTGADAAEVFRWLNTPGPCTREPLTLADAEGHVAQSLSAREKRERLPYAQVDTQTGIVIGTTSLYEVIPSLRTLGIGHTWLGRPWWQTGHNTESKLLLLRHAFDDLGAVRVVWHTDIYNERSQAAIERLGATREGVLRKHRIRFDRTWRDTVQYSMTDDDWPAARERLEERLRRS
jgi:RimJ/RimL family protein N-acetyltransferase